MSALHHRWKRYAWIILAFLPFSLKAQAPASLIGKEYLSPGGQYLRFLTPTQAFFNVDTVQYRINADTLHLIATYTWIGEQRHQFTQTSIYSFNFHKDGLTLKAHSLTSDGKKEQILSFKEITTLTPDRSPFKSFQLTKKEYLTWGGETDITGRFVRTDSVYTITKFSLHRNRRLVIEVGHLRVQHGPEGTREKYSRLSKKSTKLSISPFQQKLTAIRNSFPSYMHSNPCSSTYLHYQFDYTSKQKTYSYTRCWLNFLESPMASWDVAK